MEVAAIWLGWLCVCVCKCVGGWMTLIHLRTQSPLDKPERCSRLHRDRHPGITPHSLPPPPPPPLHCTTTQRPAMRRGAQCLSVHSDDSRNGQGKPLTLSSQLLLSVVQSRIPESFHPLASGKTTERNQGPLWSIIASTIQPHYGNQ